MKKRNVKSTVYKVILISAAYFLIIVSINPNDIWAQQKDNKVVKNTLNTPSFALKSFDAAVRPSRQEMRQFCGLVQNLMKSQDDQTRQKALNHILKATALFKEVQMKFQSDPPDEYKRDSNFRNRLSEILDNMKNIETNLAKGFKKSFQTCALTCGLFVKMHEENNLVYALDYLYHIRKLSKKLKSATETEGLEAVQKILPELLHRLDQTLLSPCPAPDDSIRCQNYQSAIKTMAMTVYDLTISVKKGSLKETTKSIDQTIAQINKAYGLAI